MLLLTHTVTHMFNGPFSGTTQISWYQKGKTNLDFSGARDSEWQWHQLGHMQVCISLHTDNHASTLPLAGTDMRISPSFLIVTLCCTDGSVVFSWQCVVMWYLFIFMCMTTSGLRGICFTGFIYTVW